MRRAFSACSTWLAFWAVGWFTVAPVAAAESDAIPESASVVLRLKAPKTALSKLGDFVNEVQPGVGEAVKANVPVLGLAISNPALAGVDTEKNWWAVVFVESRQQPAVVFGIPATDSNAVKNAVPTGWQTHVVENFVIYSDNAAALGKVRDRLNGTGTSLWAQLDGPSKKLFDGADISLLVNVKQLAKTFASELDQAPTRIDTLLEQISAAMPAAQRQQLDPALGVYRQLGKHLVQTARDANTLAVGVTFSKDLIRFEDRLSVAEGTPSAKFLSQQPANELALLKQLPANKPAYFGVHADMSSMIDWSMNMMKSMLSGATDEQKAKIEAATKQMRELKFSGMAGYFDIDTTANSGAMRGGFVSEVTPANRVREITRNMMAAMGQIQAPGIKQSVTVQPAAEKIGSAEVDLITMKQEVDPQLDPSGIQKRMITLLYGPDGMKQRVLYQQGRTLQALGGDLSTLEELMRSVDGKPATNAAAAAARQQLGEKANAVGLIDLPRLIANGIKLAIRENVLPIPLDAAQLDGLGLQPSFIGFAVGCEPTAARAQLDIPIAQAQGVARIVMLIISRARGQ